jgi:hypothetical protein
MSESSSSKPPAALSSYDNSFIKFAKLGALVVTSPLIAAVLICLVPFLCVLIACGAWVAVECLPLILVAALLIATVMVVRKRASGNNKVQNLSDRMSLMEKELHSERDRIHHLEEEVDFYKSLLEQRNKEAEGKEA